MKAGAGQGGGGGHETPPPEKGGGAGGGVGGKVGGGGDETAPEHGTPRIVHVIAQRACCAGSTAVQSAQQIRH